MGTLMRYLFAALFAAGILLGSCPTSEAFSFSKLDDEGVVLVLPMENKTEAVGLGDYLSSAEENFVTELESAGVFPHVRSMSDEQKRLDEQSLQKTGLTKAAVVSTADAVKARYVLYSSLTGLSVKRSKGKVTMIDSNGTSDAGNGSSEKVTARISVHVIDRETKETIFYGSGEGTSTSVDISANIVPIRIGAEAAPEEECNNAIWKAIQNVIEGKEGMASALKGEG